MELTIEDINRMDSHFNTHNKIKIIDFNEHSMTGQFIVEDIHTNQYKITHGGILFTIADTVAGGSLLVNGKDVLTLDSSVNFIASGKIGDVITAKSNIIKQGKTIDIVEVDVTNQDGKLLLRGTFTFFTINK